MYTSIFEYDTGDLPLYNDGDITGIDISDTKLMDKLDILDDEELILVFHRKEHITKPVKNLWII